MKIYKLPRRPDPDQPADGPRRPQRSGLQDQDGKWTARRSTRSQERHATRPAGARRHDLGRGLRAARRRRLDKRGIPHTVLNAKPEHAEREGEIVAEAGRPGAVTIATNMAGRGVDIKLGGNPEHLTRRELAQARPASPATRTTTSASPRSCPTIEEQVDERPREGRRGRRPLHLRHRAPRVAPDRQPAARPRRPPGRPGRVALLPLAPRTTSCACSPATGSTRSSTSSAPIDDDGNEEPIEAGMLSKQIEKAQKKVEEQNFLIRKRVLEYDDVMNEQRRDRLRRTATRCSRAATWATSAREEIADVIRAHRRRVHGRRLRRGLGPRRPVHRAGRHLPGRASGSTSSIAVRSTARSWSSGSSTTRGELYDAARGGARRGAHARARALPAAADHRPALARAPLRHGLPARGHPPARVRPDRPARRLQERGLRALHRT